MVIIDLTIQHTRTLTPLYFALKFKTPTDMMVYYILSYYTFIIKPVTYRLQDSISSINACSLMSKLTDYDLYYIEYRCCRQ